MSQRRPAPLRVMQVYRNASYILLKLPPGSGGVRSEQQVLQKAPNTDATGKLRYSPMVWIPYTPSLLCALYLALGRPNNASWNQQLRIGKPHKCATSCILQAISVPLLWDLSGLDLVTIR